MSSIVDLSKQVFEKQQYQQVIDTSFTELTVGTATTAETGVGASFAPAGVSSVSVSVTGDSTAQVAADAAAFGAVPIPASFENKPRLNPIVIIVANDPPATA